MKRKYKLYFMLVVGLIVMLIMLASAFANAPVKIMLNGQEIDASIPSTIVNGKTMISVKGIAEISNFQVQWDEKERTVNIIGPKISQEFVAKLIKEQGKFYNYYLDGLYYEVINIDTDDDLEILARIEGGTNIGQFFIFDRSNDGKYNLVTEKNWKVERWNTDTGFSAEGKRLFELTTRTGGTGVSVIYAHLWYMENGEYVEVWRNIMEESFSFEDEHHLKIGGYRVARDNKNLYYWQTKQSYNIVHMEGNNYDFISNDDEETTMLQYQFDDGKYVLVQ